MLEYRNTKLAVRFAYATNGQGIYEINIAPGQSGPAEREIEPGKLYVEENFNRSIEIREREKKRVEIFLSQINQNEKTIVFCANQAHALLMRSVNSMIEFKQIIGRGTPMSAQQFMELLFGKLPEFFKDEAELRAIWSAPDTRKRLL